MKATQSYTFVRTKKDISMPKETLISTLEIKDNAALNDIANLPDLNISDDSPNQYVKVLTQLIPKSEQKSM